MSGGHSSRDPLGEFLPPNPVVQGGTIRESKPRAFKPWHHYRKQLVRKEQWANGLLALAPELENGRPISYLGLPGEDMLDLEPIAKACRSLNRPLRYLGFDEGPSSISETEPRRIAEQIVHGAADIQPGSRILPHKLSLIGEANSAAQLAFREFGSFDLVNIDLCEAFTSKDQADQMHNAIAELVRHQKNKRTSPWLLFLTTRSEVGKIHEDEGKAYVKLLHSNCERSTAFSGSLVPIAGLQESRRIDPENIEDAMRRDSWIAGQLTMIALGKWLFNLHVSDGTPWRVAIQSVWGYRTGLHDKDGHEKARRPPNMISGVFRLDRIEERVTDPHGLASGYVGSSDASAVIGDMEQAFAEAMAFRVRQDAMDLDQHLAKDPSLTELLISESRDALKVRTYDPDHYSAYMGGVAKVPVSTQS